MQWGISITTLIRNTMTLREITQKKSKSIRQIVSYWTKRIDVIPKSLSNAEIITLSQCYLHSYFLKWEHAMNQGTFCFKRTIIAMGIKEKSLVNYNSIIINTLCRT